MSRPRPIPAAALLLSVLLAARAGHASGAQAGLSGGMEHLRAGRWTEAAGAFREVLAADPGAADARRGLALALANLSRSALHRGSLAEARAGAEEASALEPDNARYHLLLGAVLFRQGDLYYARYAVKRALDLEPRLPEAHELLGEILYQEGNLNLAVAEWEAALEGAPDNTALQARTEKVRREMQLEQSFGREVTRHFVIQYDSPIPDEVIEVIAGKLEESYDLLRRELGTAPPGDMTVLLYGREQFQEVTLSPRWVGGTYDGKMRLPVGGLRGAAHASMLGPMLTHELTHAFLRGMLGRALPVWFEEGLAEHFEGTTREEAARWLGQNAGRRLATFDELAAAFAARGGDIQEAYYASALAVGVLIEEEGFGSVRRMLEATAGGLPFTEALAEEMRMSLEKFQDLWRQALP